MTGSAAQAWYQRARERDGEVTAFEGVCDLVLGLVQPWEHAVASEMADKVDGLQTEDVLGLMALIGWELYADN
jgi:hypothetical protein